MGTGYIGKGTQTRLAKDKQVNDKEGIFWVEAQKHVQEASEVSTEVSTEVSQV